MYHLRLIKVGRSHLRLVQLGKENGCGQLAEAYHVDVGGGVGVGLRLQDHVRLLEDHEALFSVRFAQLVVTDDVALPLVA